MLNVKMSASLFEYFLLFFLFLGKKNFLSPSHLIYGFGFLFKVNTLMCGVLIFSATATSATTTTVTTTTTTTTINVKNLPVYNTV